MSLLRYKRRYSLPHVVARVNSAPYSECIHDVRCWLVDVELRGPDNRPVDRTIVSFTKQAALSWSPGKEYWID